MSKKALIIYYSWSGNTRTIAEIIQQQIDGELFELKPEIPYSSNYSECTKQAKNEIKSGFTPQLKVLPENLENYDTILIGSPNWWSTMAPPVASFLKQADLSGKTIAPFFTHGGGGKGRYVSDIKKLCGNASILDDLSLYGDSASATDIAAWLKRIGIKL